MVNPNDLTTLKKPNTKDWYTSTLLQLTKMDWLTTKIACIYIPLKSSGKNRLFILAVQTSKKKPDPSPHSLFQLAI